MMANVSPGTTMITGGKISVNVESYSKMMGVLHHPYQGVMFCDLLGWAPGFFPIETQRGGGGLVPTPTCIRKGIRSLHAVCPV